MARNHARILTSIWSDPDFVTLQSGDQRLYIVTITQPNMNLCGVVQYSPRRWARLSSDGDPTHVDHGMDRLTDRRYVFVDRDAEEVLARTFIRHDGVLRSPNSVIGMTRDYGGIQSPTLRELVLANLPTDFVDELHKGRIDGYNKPLPKDFVDRLGPAFMADLPKPLKPLGKGLPKPLPKPLPKGLPDPLPEGLSNGLPKGLDQGLLAGATPARTGARAIARTPPPPPPPDPPPPGATVPLNAESEQPGRPTAPPPGDEDDDADKERDTCIREACATVPGDEPPAPPPIRDRPTGQPQAAISGDVDVWDRLARVDLAAELERGGKVAHRQGWLRKAAANRREAHVDELDEWLAAGRDRESFVDRLTADGAGDAGRDDEGLRRPPSAEETAARVAEREAVLAAAAAEQARLDERIAGLSAGERAALEERARVEAQRSWSAPGRIPMPVVRASMRSLFAAGESA